MTAASCGGLLLLGLALAGGGSSHAHSASVQGAGQSRSVPESELAAKGGESILVLHVPAQEIGRIAPGDPVRLYDVKTTKNPQSGANHTGAVEGRMVWKEEAPSGRAGDFTSPSRTSAAGVAIPETSLPSLAASARQGDVMIVAAGR